MPGKKVAVITGASQGIGAALVEEYRKLGYAVVATSRNITPVPDTDVVAVRGDIAVPATAERVAAAAIERFGRIDTLVNNAGIFIAKPFTEYTRDDYEAVTGVKPVRVLPHHPARGRADAPSSSHRVLEASPTASSSSLVKHVTR
jgi:NAD(P)-dependent dehydrogenase (short-subunit alcohol dehydrogenase family)